jgi:hypothetical protein
VKNESQKKWVIERLKIKGTVSRNECLQNYISRLSAIIQNLEEDGYEFETSYIKTSFGKDFIYRMKQKGQQSLV